MFCTSPSVHQLELVILPPALEKFRASRQFHLPDWRAHRSRICTEMGEEATEDLLKQMPEHVEFSMLLMQELDDHFKEEDPLNHLFAEPSKKLKQVLVMMGFTDDAIDHLLECNYQNLNQSCLVATWFSEMTRISPDPEWATLTPENGSWYSLMSVTHAQMDNGRHVFVMDEGLHGSLGRGQYMTCDMRLLKIWARERQKVLPGRRIVVVQHQPPLERVVRLKKKDLAGFVDRTTMREKAFFNPLIRLGDVICNHWMPTMPTGEPHYLAADF